MFMGMGAGAAKDNAHVIEINREPTPLTSVTSDFLIQGNAGGILSAVVGIVREKRRKSG